MNLTGQAALVTGAGSGLGEAVARALAALGVRVALLGYVCRSTIRIARTISRAQAANR